LTEFAKLMGFWGRKKTGQVSHGGHREHGEDWKDPSFLKLRALCVLRTKSVLPRQKDRIGGVAVGFLPVGEIFEFVVNAVATGGENGYGGGRGEKAGPVAFGGEEVFDTLKSLGAIDKVVAAVHGDAHLSAQMPKCVAAVVEGDKKIAADVLAMEKIDGSHRAGVGLVAEF